MTLGASARRCSDIRPVAALERGLSGIVVDARRMSTSIAALSIAARKSRKSSRKAIFYSLLGGAAIGCLALGSGWTIYSKIFAASPYPTFGAGGYDEPVVKRVPKIVMREAGEAVREAFALLPNQVQAVAPITREMFNERFAAAAREGVASNA